MMKIFKKSNLFLFSFLVIMFSMFSMFISTAHATVTPTLSVAATGDGNSVQVNVMGDPNASVFMVYVKSGAGQQIPLIGTTSASGFLTTTISSSSYGIVSGAPVYVILDNINGPQSANVTWPAVTSLLSSGNMISLSQTGLVLTVGQSSTITASNLNGSSLYLSSNSNPLIANFSVSGSQITVLANGYGSTTGTVCLVNNTTNCASIYVMVQNSSAVPLSFSQNSISLSSGQSVAVQISGGSGSYSVLSNSSQGGALVTTSISGQIITLTTASTSGSSSITVCSTNMNSCGIVNVSIGTTNSTTTAISFSQTNPTVTIGQSSNISIYGPTSSLFYVSSNSNPSIVQANLSGSVLTLLGIANGTSTISVCSSSSNCGTLTVTVSPNYSTNGGNITLSQDTISLSVGQNSNITVSGGTMPYTTLITPNNIFQATLNSNILTIYGLAAGSSSMSVCSNGTCASVTVTVLGTGSTSSYLPVGCYSTVGYSQTTGMSCSTVVSANTSTIYPAGCYSTVGYSQTSGLPCSSTSTATTPTVPVDCTGAVYSISTGQACPVSTIITTPVVATPTTVATPTPASTNTAFIFTTQLKLGSTGTAVIQLQKKLKTLGFYKGKIDGGYGAATELAVKALQKAHKLSQVGVVGPQTRAILNK
ncbi:MAG: peptidoglycan-binding domain-containing protein [Candidatus Pacebacteria bacterium]|nr:peptidoglycan-binding domain-containing protein [Candidatus Paceibacterota bacterium]